MFEQDRYADSERRKGVFPDENDPATGMSRYRVSGSGDSEELAADRAADRVTGGLFRAPEGAAQSTGFEADLSDADLSGGGSLRRFLWKEQKKDPHSSRRVSGRAVRGDEQKGLSVR